MNTFEKDMFVSDIIKQTRQATVLSQLMHNRLFLIEGIKIAYESEQDLYNRSKYNNLLAWLRMLKEDTNGS